MAEIQTFVLVLVIDPRSSKVPSFSITITSTASLSTNGRGTKVWGKAGRRADLAELRNEKRE